jgi:hypothetical protein
MIWRAEESVDRWLAGALARSLVFFTSAEANAAAEERGRGKDRIMQGGHPFELRKKGGMDVCRGSKKRLFASVCHPFRNGLGTRAPGRPGVSLFLVNFRQISTRKIWF